MHSPDLPRSDNAFPGARPPVLGNLTIIRTSFRSAVRTIALAMTSVTVFLVMGEVLVR